MACGDSSDSGGAVDAATDAADATSNDAPASDGTVVGSDAGAKDSGSSADADASVVIEDAAPFFAPIGTADAQAFVCAPGSVFCANFDDPTDAIAPFTLPTFEKNGTIHTTNAMNETPPNSAVATLFGDGGAGLGFVFSDKLPVPSGKATISFYYFLTTSPAGRLDIGLVTVGGSPAVDSLYVTLDQGRLVCGSTPASDGGNAPDAPGAWHHMVMQLSNGFFRCAVDGLPGPIDKATPFDRVIFGVGAQSYDSGVPAQIYIDDVLVTSP
jgi:hypothetical protein